MTEDLPNLSSHLRLCEADPSFPLPPLSVLRFLARLSDPEASDLVDILPGLAIDPDILTDRRGERVDQEEERKRDKEKIYGWTEENASGIKQLLPLCIEL